MPLRMGTTIQRFADFAANLRLEDVPDDVAERARLQAMNTVSGALAGAGAASVERLREATAHWAAPGPSGVVGTGDEWEPAAAAYANAAASIAHDWDDYLYMGHTGHSAVWAARAVGDATGADNDDVLAAQIAANEIEGRLGAALFIGPHNGQFWSSIHCAGAAAAAGRVRGLDAEQIAHAIAIALYQPPFGLWPGFMGPDTKLLTAAEPVANGVRAAILAASGFTGPLDVVESPRGFLAHFSYAPRPSMLDGLGDRWLTNTLAYKEHPGCAYLQAAVEAALRLREENGVEPGDIARIDVRAGWLTTSMEKLAAGEPLTAVRVNFSVALSVAVALIAGRLTHEELADDWLAEREDDLRDLATRVFLTHDWDLTMQTIRGAWSPDAIKDIPLRRLTGLRRRMQETGMDEIGIGLSDLREIIKRTDGGALTGLFRRPNSQLPTPNPANPRMTFPCNVAIRLRSGGVLETDGRERGSCGSPLPEQQAVVAAKFDAISASAELPRAWRRRAAPTLK
ncbi:MAG: MmgE/PrpD family protein [Thermoleophilaceae bacterium]